MDIKVDCKNCDKEIKGNYPSVFCSVACKDEYSFNKPEEKKIKGDLRECRFCAKTFRLKNGSARFCSRNCYDKYYYKIVQKPKLKA